jgi:hypothetical protein
MGRYMQAAGTGFSAYGQYHQGRVQRAEQKSLENLALYNAKLAERDAEIEAKQSIFDQWLITREGAKAGGRLQAAMSASGARTDVGTLVLVREQQADEIELAKEIRAYKGEIAIGRHEAIGRGHRMQARIHKRKGEQLWSAAKMNAVNTILGGASQQYTQYGFGGYGGQGGGGWGYSGSTGVQTSPTTFGSKTT